MGNNLAKGKSRHMPGTGIQYGGRGASPGINSSWVVEEAGRPED